MARNRYEVENSAYNAFVSRAVRAFGKRIAEGAPEDLAAALEIRDELDAAIQAGVDGLLEQGYSWSEIARPLPFTREAAWKRWRKEKTA